MRIYLHIWYRDVHTYNEDTMYYLSYLIDDIHDIAYSQYFIAVISVLITFDVKGAKLMMYFTLFLKYLFLVYLFIHVVMMYLNFPLKEHKKIWDIANAVQNFITENIVLIFCFIVMSIGFIFSRVSSLLPPVIRKYMKVCLFIFGITYMMRVISRETLNSVIYRPSILSLKYERQKFWIYFMGTYPLNCAILSIVYMLNFDYYSATEENPQINSDNIMSQDLMLAF